MAAKPMHETARRRRRGTVAIALRRKRQRTLRKYVKPTTLRTYGPRTHQRTCWKSPPSGTIFSPPLWSVYQMPSVMMAERTSLALCRLRNPAKAPTLGSV